MARLMGGLLVMALLLGAPDTRAQSAAPPEAAVSADDRAAEQAVIRQQMDAFRRDDAAAAFGYAAPGIQAQFGADPDVFMSMVRKGYQPVYRPRSTTFGAVEMQDGQVVQHVDVVGPDGAAREALYFMEHEADGSWRIAGCVLIESKDVGA